MFRLGLCEGLGLLLSLISICDAVVCLTEDGKDHLNLKRYFVAEIKDIAASNSLKLDLLVSFYCVNIPKEESITCVVNYLIKELPSRFLHVFNLYTVHMFNFRGSWESTKII